MRHSHALLARLHNLLRDKLPRRAGRPAGRRRHRDALHRRPARGDHRPRSPARRRRPGGPGLSPDHLRMGPAPDGPGQRPGDPAPRRGGGRAGGHRGGHAPTASGVGPGSPGCGCDRRTPRPTAITRCWTPPWWWPPWAGARRCPGGSASWASSSPNTRRTPGWSTCRGFYRLHDGVVPPPTGGPIGGDLGYLKYAIFQGDNRTHSVTFALDTEDAELRSRLVDPDAFDRAATALVVTRPWVDPALTRGHHRRPHHGRADQPPGRVPRRRSAPPAGLPRRGRRPHLHEPPLRAGLLVGHGAGHLLADAVADHPGSEPQVLERGRLAYEQGVEREVLPWYRAAVNQDRLNRQAAVARDQQRRAETVNGTRCARSHGGRPETDDDGSRGPRRRARRWPAGGGPAGTGLHAVAHAGRADGGRAHRCHRVPGLRAVVQPARPARADHERPRGDEPGAGSRTRPATNVPRSRRWGPSGPTCCRPALAGSD